MTTILAHFDGQVFVPEEPVNVPQGRTLRLQIEESNSNASPLLALYDSFKDLPDDPEAPRDGAAQHDHYLYGTHRREEP